MEPSTERILEYLTDALSPSDRAAVEAALAASPAARESLARLSAVRDTVRDDTTWSVPATAVSAAHRLGERLAARKTPSILQRLSDAVGALVAQLQFDSRMDGALVGLRGAAGFALSYACEGIDIDLECTPTDDPDQFALMGQVVSTGAGPFVRVEPFLEGEDGTRLDPLAGGTIDPSGMFRLTLRPGRYLLRFHAANGDAKTVDVHGVELP